MMSSIETSPRRQPAGVQAAAVYDGPRWHRTRIRAWGPFVALVIPGVLGTVAWFALRWFDTASSGAVGLLGGVLAAPALLGVGAPFGERSLYPIAVAASGVIWLLVGVLASRRATRHPFATWGDFWKHYLTMLIGIWIGAFSALVIATLSLGETLW